MTALLLSLLAAAPVEGRFVLEVDGLPLAELRAAAEGTRYVYDVVHFLDEGPKTFHQELTLAPDAPVPEVLAIMRKPGLGCRAVLEERTRKTEQLCFERALSPMVLEGTLDGVRLAARYDETGRLLRVELPGIVWKATSKATTPPVRNPFVDGVPVPEGALTLAPPVKGARWLTVPPLGIGDEKTVGRVRCLVAAREAARARPKAEVVVGLVIEEGRAYPHAWLVENGLALDPSVLAADPVLARRRYLQVPKGTSGAFYLQLFDGTQRLVAK